MLSLASSSLFTARSYVENAKQASRRTRVVRDARWISIHRLTVDFQGGLEVYKAEKDIGWWVGYIERGGVSPRRIDSIYGATCHRGRGFWSLKFPWECFPARGMEKSRGDRGFDRLEELRPETSSERLHCTCIDVNSPPLPLFETRFVASVFRERVLFLLFSLSLSLFCKWKYELENSRRRKGI